MISSRLIIPNLSLPECGGIKAALGGRKVGVRRGEAALSTVIDLIQRKRERAFLDCLTFVWWVIIEQSGAGHTGSEEVKQELPPPSARARARGTLVLLYPPHLGLESPSLGSFLPHVSCPRDTARSPALCFSARCHSVERVPGPDNSLLLS